MIDARTEEQKQSKGEQAKGPTFTFRRALPEGMTVEEERRRCEEAFQALAEGAAR